MRVLTVGNMYPPLHLGGYELMWESWVEHARRQGHEVSVLTTDYRTAPGVPDTDNVARDLRWYWHEHRFPRLGLRENLRLERHNLAVLGRELERVRPDAVAWWAMGGMSMSLIEEVRRLRIPALGVIVDDWLVYGPQVDGWRRRWRRPRMLPSLVERVAGVPTAFDIDRAARWIFVSKATHRRAEQGGAEVGPGQIVHAGIDPGMFPAAEAREWRWRLLYLGRIDRRKGIETAVRALTALPDVATLEIVGGGDDEHQAELVELAGDLGVSERVRFSTHARERLADVYAAADVLLFPVLWDEPFGLVPLEAMSVGRPVVATGTGGSAEYLRDGVNCLLFRPIDDPAALAARVTELANDLVLRERLVAAGRTTASSHTADRFNAAVTNALTSMAADVS